LLRNAKQKEVRDVSKKVNKFDSDETFYVENLDSNLWGVFSSLHAGEPCATFTSEHRADTHALQLSCAGLMPNEIAARVEAALKRNGSK
jgi:hypothetical protein